MAEEIEELTIESLPEKIRDWISSNQVTLIIKDINRRLGITGGRRIIIPTLIHDIVTFYLDPADLTNELAEEFGMNQVAAKQLAQEIEQKILRPIGRDLLNEMNIDIKSIYYGKKKEGPEEQPQMKAPTEKVAEMQGLRKITEEATEEPFDNSPQRRASRESKEAEKREFAQQIPTNLDQGPPSLAGQARKATESEAKIDLKKFEGATPFILHQHKEEEFAKPTEAETRPKLRIAPPPAKEERKEKSVAVRFETGKKAEEVKPLPTMPTIEEEEPEPITNRAAPQQGPQLDQPPKEREINYSIPKTTQIIKPQEQPEKIDQGSEQFVDSDKKFENSDRSQNNMRVVHYHDLRTPLNSVGLPKKTDEGK